jgi:starvation-inducible outer membrane lipoprotein
MKKVIVYGRIILFALSILLASCSTSITEVEGSFNSTTKDFSFKYHHESK